MSLQRYDFVDRISTAIDDHQHLVRQSIGNIGGPRVTIGMSELRSADGDLSNRLRLDPLRHIRALELACHEISTEDRPGYDKECGKHAGTN